MIVLLTIALISCQKDEVITGKKTGSLTVNIGLLVNDHEVNSSLKASGPAENFRVTIFRSDGTIAILFETALLMPDTIELEPGSYYVEAHSNNNLPAAFENPYYYGVSEEFSISSNMQQSVQVNCRLANTMVSVEYSINTVNSFIDYITTVSSTLGSLVFIKDETRPGFFQPSPLTIMVELTSLNLDGSESTKTLNGNIPNPLAGRHYEIIVNTSMDAGNAVFQILLDETEIPVEIVEILDQQENDDDDDDEITELGTVAFGELLITEIMSDPSALSDTEGEWIEIYNNSDHAINLQDLVLVRETTNRHTIGESIELLPGNYFILERAATSTDAPNHYIYGSAIVLPNTGAVLSIFNKDSEGTPGALIFSVNYGGPDFTFQAGASISLNPANLNAADAASGTSWCISTSAFNTGDRGTPGMVNDSCL